MSHSFPVSRLPLRSTPSGTQKSYQQTLALARRFLYDEVEVLGTLPMELGSDGLARMTLSTARELRREGPRGRLRPDYEPGNAGNTPFTFLLAANGTSAVYLQPLSSYPFTHHFHGKKFSQYFFWEGHALTAVYVPLSQSKQLWFCCDGGSTRVKFLPFGECRHDEPTTDLETLLVESERFWKGQNGFDRRQRYMDHLAIAEEEPLFDRQERFWVGEELYLRW